MTSFLLQGIGILLRLGWGVRARLTRAEALMGRNSSVRLLVKGYCLSSPRRTTAQSSTQHQFKRTWHPKTYEGREKGPSYAADTTTLCMCQRVCARIREERGEGGETCTANAAAGTVCGWCATRRVVVHKCPSKPSCQVILYLVVASNETCFRKIGNSPRD